MIRMYIDDLNQESDMSSAQSVTQHRSAPTPQIIPSGKGCGAEVTGVSLAMLDSRTVTTLQQAVLNGA